MGEKITRRRTLFTGLTCFACSLIPAFVSGEASGQTLRRFRRGANLRLIAPSLHAGEDVITANKKRLVCTANAGFDFVRVRLLPAEWNCEFNCIETNLQRTLEQFCVDALEVGLSTIVVIFGPNETTRSAQAVLCDDVIKARYLRFAAAVAHLIARTPRVGAEFLNEPPPSCHNGERRIEWTALQRVLYDDFRVRVRGGSTVLGGVWADIDSLSTIPLTDALVRDPETYFTFHFYEPLIFTHQSESWDLNNPASYVSGLKWPYEMENAKRVLDKAEQIHGAPLTAYQLATLRGELEAYAQIGTRAHIMRRFDQVASWANSNSIDSSRVLLGEFGVFRGSHGSNIEPTESALSWLGAVREEAEKRGFGWAVWDLDSDFSLVCGRWPAEGVCSTYASSLGLNVAGGVR